MYRAHDPRLNRNIAIKVIAEAAARDPDRLRRFEQEARAASALNHPGILAVYDVGTQGASPYVVSELLEGQTLRQKIRSSGLPQQKAVDYAIQVARALAAAHEKAIVHRGLKPENLFVTSGGHVKILDFGLAKLTRVEAIGSGSGSETVTRDAESGSPAERFQSARDLAFHLEALGSPSGAEALPQTRSRSRSRAWWASAAVALLGAGLASGVTLGGAFRRSPSPRFTQLTYRRGTVTSARFASDGQTVVYGAAWSGSSRELFSTRASSRESRALGVPDADILSISSSGDMALLLAARESAPGVPFGGTVARAPLSGGAPRTIAEDGTGADWAPQGDGLAVARCAGDGWRLEYPPGKVVYEARSPILHPRLSPRGDRLAFFALGDGLNPEDGIVVVDLATGAKTARVGGTP